MCAAKAANGTVHPGGTNAGRILERCKRDGVWAAGGRLVECPTDRIVVRPLHQAVVVAAVDAVFVVIRIQILFADCDCMAKPVSHFRWLYSRVIPHDAGE